MAEIEDLPWVCYAQQQNNGLTGGKNGVKFGEQLRRKGIVRLIYIPEIKLFMLVRCYNCHHKFDVPEESSSATCPKCNSRVRRVKGIRSIKEIQEILIARLDEFEKTGITHARWLNAKDKFVCPACSKLAKKIFTVSEARDITKIFPCTADPWEQGCRCCWVAERDPNEHKSDPNKKRRFSVVSRVETDKKADETTVRIVFDLVRNKCDACGLEIAPLFKIVSGQFLCEKCLQELRENS